MYRDLSRCLHVLTSRADRAADRLLRAERGVSYSRFLALYTVGELGATTQRQLAEQLGVTEPSVSRMVRALAGEGLLAAPADPVGGNRRSLELTAAGRRLVAGCGGLLEDRFAALVDAAGVSYEDYRDATVRLLAALSGDGPPAGASPEAGTRHAHADGRAS